jgi:hypothetical protein
MTEIPAALDLQGLPGTTTTLSPSSVVYARVGIAVGTASLNQLQNVRFGAPGPLTVSFATPSNGVGTLLKAGGLSAVSQTATIPIGSSNTPTDTTSGGVAFHALIGGITTVAATIPGFVATTAATRSITVSQPGITVNPVTVGSGLQVATSLQLGAPNHGNIDVTLRSSNGAVLVSPAINSAGSGEFSIPVADGVQSVTFYVQGLEGQTGTLTGTVTAIAPGFTNGTAAISVVQAAVDLQGLPASTTLFSPWSAIYARVGVAQAGNAALNQLQNVRAGAPGPLTVTFTTPADNFGELRKAGGLAGVTQTAQIPIGSSNTPTDTTTGGVMFRPLSAGTTTVAASIPGLISTTAATRSVSVSVPGITLNGVTVGSGLQVPTSFTLGGANHGGVNVTLTSSDPALLLSPSITTAGQSQIVIPVANGTQSVSYYVQGLEGRTTTLTVGVTAQAPGFTDGTANDVVVQPSLDLQGVPSGAMTVGQADAGIYVRLGISDANNQALTALQAVRAGLPGGSIGVTISSSNVSAASLVTSILGPASSQTLPVLSGQSSTPSTVAAGGIGLRPVAAGTSAISGSAAGFITTAAGTRTATVQ